MTTPTPESSYDMTAIATRVMYELLGRRWSPRMRVIDAYPASHELVLSGRPVKQIIAVTAPDGSAITGYELASGFRLRLPYGALKRCVSCRQQEVIVEYEYGSKAPQQVQLAIDELAQQLTLAEQGSSECKLPKRVQSISRQGLSMTILDPQDFLDKGRTGLIEVDQAIMVFNRSAAKARARVFSSQHPPPRRLSATTVVEPVP